MIVKKFVLDEMNLTYYVGITQIKKKSTTEPIEKTFQVIKELQNDFNTSIIQFFLDRNVLNHDHIFHACYFVQKATTLNRNISSNQQIEILLYLAANREISKSIKRYGISKESLEAGNVICCIMNNDGDFSEILETISRKLNAVEIPITLESVSAEKFKRIKDLFDVADHQIEIILKSYNVKENIERLLENDVNILVDALGDLLCEKMSLLSLEKVKSD